MTPTSREEPVLTEGIGDLLLVHVDRDGLHVLFHDLRELDRPARAQHPAERRPAEGAMHGVDDVEVIEVVGKLLGGAHVVDGLADGPRGGHGDDLTLHEPAGAILGKGEAFLDQRPIGLRQGRYDAVADLFVELFEHLDGIVACQLGERLGKFLGLEFDDDVGENRLVQV
jgi:hypothetical protein